MRQNITSGVPFCRSHHNVVSYLGDMMKVTCSQCLAVYNIPEHKLQKDVSRTTCRKCGNRIEIRKPKGITSIKPIFESSEELSAPHPLNTILDQAKPKRIHDDERTTLDEERMEQPRPAVMTNLAFGPNPSEKTFSDDDSLSFPADTMPSIRPVEDSESQEEEEVSESDEVPDSPTSVIVEDSEEETFRLDWVVAFCGDVLALGGVILMVVFIEDQRFSWACMVALFGICLSLMIGLSSRFGERGANIIVSVLSSVIAVLIFNVLYLMVFPVS